MTQVVFDPERSPESAAAHAVAKDARLEYVLQVEGVVAKRLEGKENPEPRAPARSRWRRTPPRCSIPRRTLPFPIADRVTADEALRLRYRYLDLRRDTHARQASSCATAPSSSSATTWTSRGFLEVETPILTKSTPEGARDYLVPSRLYPGEFYALPQAPQQFKQLLMVAGIDRYFQIARCFRDEDLRADRQPEFTQLDVEMSFVDERGRDGSDRGAADRVDRERRRRSASSRRPFPHITFAEAMEKYGIDRPDLRFELLLTTVSELAASGRLPGLPERAGEGWHRQGTARAGHSRARRAKSSTSCTSSRGSSAAKGLVTLALPAGGAEVAADALDVARGGLAAR